jgi:non-specific protein-tyrosine kinase
MATNAIVGGVIGFYLALLLAFAWEFAVDRVRATEDVEEKLGLPLLAGVDRFKNGCNILEEEPDSRPATSYRQLRSNLRYLTATDDIKALVLTSANVDEGKSTTATNLAIVLAQGGETVILVDADLRRYEPERQPDVSGSVGLTGLLRTDHPDIPAALVATRWPNLWLLPAGPLPPRPADLLGSDRMTRLTRTLRGMAKYVIFDTPPMLAVPDARLLAENADAALVVTAAGKTRTRSLRRVVRTLNQTRSQVLGVVLNKLTPPRVVKPGIAEIAAADLPRLEAPKVDRKALREEERLKRQAKREAADRAKRIKELQKKVEQARKKNKEQVAAMDTTPEYIPAPTPPMPHEVELPTVAALRELAKPVEAFSAQAAPLREAARPSPEPVAPPPVLPKPIVVETRTTTFVVPAATTSLDTSGLEERLTSLQAKLAGIRSATRAESLRQVTSAPARPQAAVPAGVSNDAPQPGSPDPKVEELLARLNDTVGLIQSLNKPAIEPGKEEA